SKLGLRAGHHISVRDCILGIVTESANDAATVLGEAIGGSEAKFGRMMTMQARALGMTRTFYRNPSGLPDPKQVTTARDTAILAAALIYHYPEFYHYFDIDGFTYRGVYFRNHDNLKYRYAGMDGLKTGYIRASGFNLASSAKRDGIRLIGVIFGGKSALSRDNRMAHLLDAGFANEEAENRSDRFAAATGEGDGDNPDNEGYIALPAKIGMASSPRRESPKIVQAVVHVEQPAPRRAANDNWGVQIGAFSDAAIGRQALASLVASMPGRLGQADKVVEPISVGGVSMYRARLMAMNEETARSLCVYLIQHGQSCLTVQP
ncbi:MAG: D-alanyl-D-alanine carboxypeptidase, partial [Alphaproteobacteria bacterium]|nr:D-alanyl-D-alanine carboxypeptidase [Alphaproteobacteria bacterium]